MVEQSDNVCGSCCVTEPRHGPASAGLHALHMARACQGAERADDHLVDKRREGRDSERDHGYVPIPFVAWISLTLDAMHVTAPFIRISSWIWPLETFEFGPAAAKRQCQHKRNPH